MHRIIHSTKIHQRAGHEYLNAWGMIVTLCSYPLLLGVLHPKPQ